MSLGHKVNVYGNLGYMLGIKSRMDGEMNGRMDGGMDAGWTLGGLWVDSGWTVSKILERDGHGRWTGWSRKPDGMVTEAGRDGQTKTISFNSFFNYKN